MQGITSVWASLDIQRRVIVTAATLAVFATVLMLSRIATSPEMALLYSGLDSRQSGEVIQALDTRAVLYQVRGEAIFVDAAKRDRLRMELASEGMPANAGAGYEILDELSGFGTTSQMFDAAYWRAKEGELARTILASPDVRHVRVHIANHTGGTFRKSAEPTASVMISPKGTLISESTAEAFKYLVALAVPDLLPENVAIIDSVSGRIIGLGDEDAAVMASSSTQAALLKSNVERLLQARVGLGNSVVELAIEPVTESETIRERRVDPDSRVAISTDIEEIVTSEKNGAGDAVTVASNLPDGDGGSTSAQSESQNSETRTITNFDLSETTRDIERQAGAIKRLTVAVLLNTATLMNELSNETNDLPEAERIEQEIQNIEELIAASIGIDESRGDKITVKAMRFEPASILGTEAPESSWLSRIGASPMQFIQLAIFALVAVVLGLFVIKPILTGRKQDSQVPRSGFSMVPVDLENAEIEPYNSSTTQRELYHESSGSGMNNMANRQALSEIEVPDFGQTALRSASEDPQATSSDPVATLKTMIEERQPDTLEILRNWIEDDKTPEFS